MLLIMLEINGLEYTIVKNVMNIYKEWKLLYKYILWYKRKKKVFHAVE